MGIASGPIVIRRDLELLQLDMINALVEKDGLVNHDGIQVEAR